MADMTNRKNAWERDRAAALVEQVAGLEDVLTARPAADIWEVVDGTQKCNRGNNAMRDRFHPDANPARSYPVPRDCNSGCRFKVVCLQWGLRHEREGVWGGMAPGDRNLLRRALGVRLETPATDFLSPVSEAKALAARRKLEQGRTVKGARGRFVSTTDIEDVAS